MKAVHENAGEAQKSWVQDGGEAHLLRISESTGPKTRVARGTAVTSWAPRSPCACTIHAQVRVGVVVESTSNLPQNEQRNAIAIDMRLLCHCNDASERIKCALSWSMPETPRRQPSYFR